MCGSMNAVGFGSNPRVAGSDNNTGGGISFNTGGGSGMSMPPVDLSRGSGQGDNIDISG